jgi:hypothetical protein
VLLYDWRFTANPFVLGPSPLRPKDRFLFSQLNTCGHSPYVTSSVMRGWVCNLQLLLALASAFILGSESRGTRDHILLSQIRDFHFCRLLRLAGLRWRHSTLPPHGIWCAPSLGIRLTYVDVARATHHRKKSSSIVPCASVGVPMWSPPNQSIGALAAA